MGDLNHILAKAIDDGTHSLAKAMQKKVPSDKLKKEIKVTGLGEISIGTSLYFADKGRGSGKMPSINVIEPWCKSKGIPLEYAYPIAYNIGKKGTKGKHYFDDISSELKDMYKMMGEQLRKPLSNEIKKMTSTAINKQ